MFRRFRNYPQIGGKRKYTARDYVQDGLIAMWDGIENAGWGVHDSSATVWKDLVGGNDATLNTSSVFGDDYMSCYSTNGAKTSENIAYTSVGTIEFVGRRNGSGAAIFGLSESTLRHGIVYQGGAYHTNSNNNTNNIGIAVADDVILSVSFTKDSGWNTVNAYRDGFLSSDATLYGTAGQVGRGFGGSINAGSCLCHCLRIYNRALTAAEIAANYAIDKERFGL